MKINTIWKNRWVFRSLFKTIWFNFHYLPINQAIKLPIILYKVKLKDCRGKIILEGEAYSGQVVLGKPLVSLYPANGLVYENHGGTIVFKGNCVIGGGNSALSIGSTGRLSIGNNVVATAALHLVCYNRIVLNNNIRIGWNCLIADTDFHSMTKVNASGNTKGYGVIVIGNYNWIGTGCMILKNSQTPDYITISAHSTLSEKLSVPEYSVISTVSTYCIKHSGIYLNPFDDAIKYN